MINNLVRQEILQMQEINWGDIPDNSGMRLLWGENPLTPDVCIRSIKKEAERVNLYPSPTQIVLREKLAEYAGVTKENIVITNGTDDAIELICKVFINKGEEVIIPSPTFPVYSSSSLLMGAKVISIPLEGDFSLNAAKVLNAVTKKTKIIWIANPNNPTGNIVLAKENIADIALNAKCLVVIDECYFELSGVSVVPLIKKFPNILVLRSFSKSFALAGLRLGYIVGSNKFVKFINKLKQTNEVFSVNRLSLVAGLAALDNKEKMKKSIKRYKKLKSDFEQKLKKIKELKILKTKTSFCLINIYKARISSEKLSIKLRKKNIFIKDCSIYKGLGAYYVYLGVPAEKFQKLFVDEIEKIIKEKV